MHKALANQTEKVSVSISFSARKSLTGTGTFAPIVTAWYSIGDVSAGSIAAAMVFVVAAIPWLLLLTPTLWLWSRRLEVAWETLVHRPANNRARRREGPGARRQPCVDFCSWRNPHGGKCACHALRYSGRATLRAKPQAASEQFLRRGDDVLDGEAVVLQQPADRRRRCRNGPCRGTGRRGPTYFDQPCSTPSSTATRRCTSAARPTCDTPPAARRTAPSTAG